MVNVPKNAPNTTPRITWSAKNGRTLIKPHDAVRGVPRESKLHTQPSNEEPFADSHFFGFFDRKIDSDR